MINQAAIEDFYSFFTGNTNAYGEFETAKEIDEKGKVPGKARTITQTIKKENYESHLVGKIGLGIIPINNNHQCRFGLIDIDDYTIKLKNVNEKITQLNLPLILFRSKSGGAHIYLFLRTPTSAVDVIETLRIFAHLLGYDSIEIFPKQKVLSKGAVGNWINLPYFNAEKTDRYAYNREFKQLDLYEAIKFIKNELRDISEIKSFIESLPFQDGPPCLQRLFITGVGQGGRNEFLFNTAIYLKQKYTDDWEDKLTTVNRKLQSPLPATELEKSVTNSLKKKEYFYRCTSEPLKSVCSKSSCRLRDYGIENASIPSEVIGALSKIIFHANEVSWELEVNDGKLYFEDTRDIMKHVIYQQKCMEQLNIWPRNVKQEAWRKIIEERLKEVTEMKGAEELSKFGQFKVLLNRFLETTNIATNREQMLIKGKIYYDKTHTKCYFRGDDLMRFISDNRVYNISNGQMWKFLHEVQATNKNFIIKINNDQIKVNKKIKVWQLSDIEESITQYLNLDILEIKEKEEQNEPF